MEDTNKILQLLVPDCFMATIDFTVRLLYITL